MRPEAVLLTGLLLSATGCGEITPPLRETGYTFRHTSGVIFRWTPERIPVRYWVAPNAGAVTEYVQRGLAVWSNQLLYGEFRFVLVPDSTDADVLIRVLPDVPPASALSDAPPEPSACRGVTTFNVTTDFTALSEPLRVEVDWDGRFTAEDIANCLHRVTVHEIGHTLGIFAHSPNADDLMAPIPLVREPTLMDRRTVEQLYHTPPDLAPPPQ